MKSQLLVAGLICSSVVPMAMAGPQLGDMGEITLNGVLGNFGGGEFSWSGSGGNYDLGNFVSFCVELNEGVAVGQEYKWTLNNAAVLGGAGGPSPDPLDSKTAALYTAFKLGTLGNYSTTGSISFNAQTYSRSDQAAALQMAIWFLEDEINTVDAVTEGRSTNQALADKIEALALDFLAQADALDTGSIGNIRILNVTQLDGSGNHQDMLIMVPLPQAGALAGLGLAGIAIRRRR